MSRIRRRTKLRGLIALYLIGLGMLGGMLVERIRFNVKRDAILATLDSMTKELHGRLMQTGSRTDYNISMRSGDPGPSREPSR